MTNENNPRTRNSDLVRKISTIALVASLTASIVAHKNENYDLRDISAGVACSALLFYSRGSIEEKDPYY